MSVYDIDGNKVVTDGPPIGLHTIPDNEGVLNTIKRARQLTDVKWTPAVDIPRLTRYSNYASAPNELYQDKFEAGVEYTGIPYTSAKGAKVERYGYTRVVTGCFTGIDTFVTSAANADSFFCEESTYDTSIMLGAMYGSTCCGLVSYAIDIPWTNTENFGGLITNGTLASKGTVSSSVNYELGDILLKTTSHVAIITDISKDNDGDIVFIEVSENTTGGAINPSNLGGQYGGHARRFGWALSDFLRQFNGYTVCKYGNISTVTYTPSEYVNVGDELEMRPPTDYPCLPYMGENFVYKAGHIYSSDILIASDDFDYLAVYKDGSLFNTFTINSATKISTNFTAAGDYEAFLYDSSDGTVSNLTARTISCHWTVE